MTTDERIARLEFAVACLGRHMVRFGALRLELGRAAVEALQDIETEIRGFEAEAAS